MANEPIDTAGQGAPAPAAAPPSTTPAQGAPAASPWELVVDETTKYTDPAKAKESFLDARKQIGTLNEWKEKLGGFNIKRGDETVSAAESFDDFVQLVSEMLEPKGTPAQAAPADGPLDVSKLSPEYQQHIDILRKTGQFAAAERMESMAKELEQLKGSVNGIQQRFTDDERATTEKAISEGRSFVAAVAKEAGFTLDEAQQGALAKAIEAQIVDASADPKTGKAKPGSIEERYLKGDTATRQAIVKEQFAIWQNIADGYAKKKSAGYAEAKTAAMAGTPKPLGQAGGSAPPAAGKRVPESERMETIRNILSQATAQ